MKQVGDPATVAELCYEFGYSRTAYYKSINQEQRAALEEDIVIEMIIRQRDKSGPRMGIKKIYHCIKDDLRLAGIKLGRDGIYEISRRNNLIVKPKKRHRISTTDSSKWRRRFKDLRQNFWPVLPEQLFVVDITYVRILDGFVYLSLVTDATSRKMMGLLRPSRSVYHRLPDRSGTGTGRTPVPRPSPHPPF